MGRLISLVDCLRSSPSEDGDEINPKEVYRDFSEGARDGVTKRAGRRMASVMGSIGGAVASVPGLVIVETIPRRR